MTAIFYHYYNLAFLFCDLDLDFDSDRDGREKGGEYLVPQPEKL